MIKVSLLAFVGVVGFGSSAWASDSLFDTLEASGATITSGEIAAQDADGVTIDNFVFERFLNRFSAEKIYIDGDFHRFVNVKIEAMRGGDGVIYADELTLHGPQSVWALYTMGGFVPSRDVDGGTIYSEDPEGELALSKYWEPDCAGLEGNGSQDRFMQAHGVVIQGDLDSMPLGFSMGEKFTAAALETTFRFTREDDTCDMSAKVDARDMKVYSAGGDYLAADRTLMGWEGLGDIDTGEGTLGRSFELENVVLDSAEGIRSLSVEKISFELDQNSIWSGFACLVILGPDVFDVTDFDQAFSEGRYDISFMVDGFDIDVDAFFPPDLIAELGISTLETLSGDVAMSSRLDDGVAEGHVVFDMPQIIDLAIDAKASFPETRSAVLPPMMSEGLPIPSEVMQLNIHAFNLSYDDLGLGKIVQHLTGSLPADHAANGYEVIKPVLSGKIPGFFMNRIDGIASSIIDFVGTGGRFSISPSEPMSVMNAGIQIMMSPATLSQTMGLSTSSVD